jgi:hypothetical protein
MKIINAILICIYMMLPANMPQEAKGWRGIMPLHSTRTDVERVLGSPGGMCKCIYDTKNERVYVEYASAPCKGFLPGWNVPSGTVLSVTVTSKSEQQFSDLNIDESKFVKTYDDTMTVYYINKEEGIKYRVSDLGIVKSISYIPSVKDNHLRCSGFPMYDGSITKYRPFEKYSPITSSDERARLDNFAVQLQNELNLKGYIIAYAGRRARAGEAIARAERARDHLVQTHGINAERVIAMDGGYREKLEVELYLVRSDLPAPTPTPTLAPSEVQIIQNGQVNKRTRRQAKSLSKQSKPRE